MARRRGSTTSVSFFAFQDIITSVVGIFVLITLIMVLELAQTVSDTQSNSSESVSRDLLNSLASLESDLAEMRAEFDALSSDNNAATKINRFNREEELKKAQARLEQTQQRIKRVEQEIADIQQSLVEAKQIHQQMIARDQAAESEREELKDLQEKQQAIERYSSVLAIDKPIIFRDQTQEGRYVVLVQLQEQKITVTDSADNSHREFNGSNRAKDFQQWVSSLEVKSRQILIIVKPDGVDDFDLLQDNLNSQNLPWGFDVAAKDANFRLHCEVTQP